jgi:hypothetical protein
MPPFAIFSASRPSVLRQFVLPASAGLGLSLLAAVPAQAHGVADARACWLAPAIPCWASITCCCCWG